LILHDRISPPARHFRNAVDTTDEDCDICDNICDQKIFEACRVPKDISGLVEFPSEFPDAEEDFDSHQSEYGQRYNL
jgi:hypothetical protein